MSHREVSRASRRLMPLLRAPACAALAVILGALIGCVGEPSLADGAVADLRVGRLHQLIDWTRGCIAVTDAEVDEIWRAVPDGTPVEIRP